MQLGLVGEDRGDTGALLGLLVKWHEAVGRAEASPKAGSDTEDREGLRENGLDPVGELQHCLPVAGEEACESPLCLGRAIGVEDAASVASSSEARPRMSFVPNRCSA